MTQKYEHPAADFSAAIPPKNRKGLDVAGAAILPVLRKRLGRVFTATEILGALGESIDIADNHAAVIAAACAMVERHQIEAGEVTHGDRTFPGWFIPKPKPVETKPDLTKPAV